MKIRDLSPIQLAKRIYNASQKSWALTSTFGYETRAADAGETRTAKGHILTRTTTQKDNSALAAFLKNPTLTIMVADILARGTQALKDWTNSLERHAHAANGSYGAGVTAAGTQATGFGEAVSKLADIMLTKLGLLKEPKIQSNGLFSRDHFHVASRDVARDAVNFIKLQTEHANTMAQQLVEDKFQGPFMPAMQTQVDALRSGKIDKTTFATANLKDSGGIYNFGDHDYAITPDLAERLNTQFGQSADTVTVDAVVAFRRAVPTAPVIEIDYSAPARAFRPSGF